MLHLLAQTVETLAADPTPKSGMAGWMFLVIVFGIFTIPHMVAELLSRLFRVGAYSSRLGTVLMVLTLGVAAFSMRYMATPNKSIMDCFRLGIDLAGGTNLVYQVNRDEAAKLTKDIGKSLDNMVGAISRRINPQGTEEVTVRRVGLDRIEIIIPGADQSYVEEMKRRIATVGALEFQILATNYKGEHKSLVSDARKLPQDKDIVVQNKVVVARWVTLHPGNEKITNGGDTLDAEFRTVKRGADGELNQVLVAISPERQQVTGKFLVRASEDIDQRTATPSVSFQFNTQGGTRFFNLTSSHLPTKASDGKKYRLAILLDGKIQSAPVLNEAITNNGQITGTFTQKEVKALVDVLNAGALDVPLERNPVSEFTISPLLGEDVRTKGIRSCLISALLVIVFMAVYYLKAGVVADLCLAMNIFLTLATMVFVQATFTLPGLAALALTMGMSVDANVLIYERMREEIERKASIKKAIHEGFDKAFSAIFDSNITSLIASAILYMVGTDQVKGFAVTLFIGISTSMFTTLYVGRLVFELLDEKRWLKNLHMLQAIKTPTFDYMGKQKIAMTASAVALVIGGLAFAYRGGDNFDIDFRGGTMVTFQFNEAKAQSEFRPKLEEQFGAAISVERLTIETEKQAADSGRRWRMRTTNDKQKEVEAGVSSALFSMGLKRTTGTVGPLNEVVAPVVKEGEAVDEKRTSYAGGHECIIGFEPQVNSSTAAQAFLDGLTEVSDSKVKYPQPAILFEIEGTKGDGKTAKVGQVQKFSELRLWVSKDVAKADIETGLAAMSKKLESTPLFEEVTSFAGAVGDEARNQALLAMLLSLISMVVYVWFRFENLSWGLGASAALLHDVLIAALALPVAGLLAGVGIGGYLGFEDFKINLQIVAALLTIVGYSINDTIVIFDRVREIRGKNLRVTSEMFNQSLNQTMSRTLLTATTVLITVIVMYFWGGESIHAFAFCLLVGSISGVYSTIYIASPVVIWLIKRAEQQAAVGKKVKAVVAKL